MANNFSLVMWSGGIDSTFTLAWLLKDTKDDVHAHHVVIQNSDGRYEVEVEIIKRIIPKLRKIRNFGFTFSKVEHGNLKVLPWDMQVVGFEAGVISRNLRIGYNKPFTRWTIGTHKSEGHWETRFEKIEACTAAVTWPYDPPKFWLPKILPTKAEEIKYLHDLDILKLSWYCRYPVVKDDGWYRCNECKTCKEVAEAVEAAGLKMSDTCEFIDHVHKKQQATAGQASSINMPKIMPKATAPAAKKAPSKKGGKKAGKPKSKKR